MKVPKSKAVSKATKTGKKPTNKGKAVRGVPGVRGTVKKKPTKTKQQKGQPTDAVNRPISDSSVELIWNEDGHAIENYEALGQCLAQSPDLFRKPAYGIIRHCSQPVLFLKETNREA